MDTFKHSCDVRACVRYLETSNNVTPDSGLDLIMRENIDVNKQDGGQVEIEIEQREKTSGKKQVNDNNF